jgi:DNA-binding MarR family transcriptional regulator
MASSPLPTADTAAELSIVDALTQLSFLIHGALERRATERDLTMISTRLLGVLRDRKPSMNQLAKLLDLDKSSITGLVDRAERRGLVERTPSSSDGRAVLVSLTGRGRSLVSKVEADFGADVASMLDSLPTTDCVALASLAARVVAGQTKAGS